MANVGLSRVMWDVETTENEQHIPRSVAAGSRPRTAHSGAQRQALVPGDASAPERAPVRGHPLTVKFLRRRGHDNEYCGKTERQTRDGVPLCALVGRLLTKNARTGPAGTDSKRCECRGSHRRDDVEPGVLEFELSARARPRDP